MGQTLSNGVYLPNEGERNCYAGLASNWQILNTAVGNIAEKAPLVHTHGNITNDGKIGTTANVPLITGTGGVVQTGSFGNQANTFCEGNDSRLSDARTPLSHTHTKSDVTDLLNSNFIPSANNSYDLGSSSYQWNNLYAKNYYYNGVAWGLDKNNVWTRDNTFKGNIFQNQGDANYIIPRGTNTVKGDLTTSGSSTLIFKDKNNGNLATSGIAYLNLGQNSSGSYATMGVETIGSTDSTRHSNSISLKIDPTTNNNTAQFYPVNNNATDLGTSDNKWKSLNGVNPGALSLPNFDSDGYVDLSSDITENVQYTYTPVVDGWLALYAQVNGFHAENAVGIFNADLTLGNDSFRWANTATAAIILQRQTGKYFGSIFLPVRAGYPYYCWLRVDQSTTLGQKKLIFYKAKGNV